MEYSSHLHLTPLAINYSVSSCLFYSWSVDAPLLRSGVRENARGAACVARLHRDGRADARRAVCCRWHSTDLRRGNVNELRTARYLGVHERTEVFVSQGERDYVCVCMCVCKRERERGLTGTVTTTATSTTTRMTATTFSTLSTLLALRHVRPSVESELVWRGEREGTPAFACLPACQPWTPAVATPRGAGVPERPRNRTS